MFLVYGGEDELGVKGYTDVSYLTDLDDSRSQSGYVFVMNRGVVSWKSSKQDIVSASTTEAEYIAARLDQEPPDGSWCGSGRVQFIGCIL